MQNICYRCGRSIEERTPFCPACGAPQIRVSTPEQPLEVLEKPQGLPPDLAKRPFPPSGDPALIAGIVWRDFIHSAAPLAALTGILTLVLPPLGLFVLLPANLVWAISRYLRRRPTALRSGHGARMGAMMGVLSFGFFLASFCAAISLFWADYRNVMIGRLHEIAAQNPDPQAQQMMQRITTPDGFMVFTAFSLVAVLLIFLVIGMASGALAIALGRGRNRP